MYEILSYEILFLPCFQKENFMRRVALLCLCIFFSVCAPSFATLIPPQRATTSVPEVPVAALRSTYPPHDPIWVRAKIIEQTDNDTFVIGDRTGQITLFLPNDELLSLALYPGMEILILGTVDISPILPEKNEFYAERILLPPNTEHIE
jgi:uncharacterized protein YdeI (BOF family)